MTEEISADILRSLAETGYELARIEHDAADIEFHHAQKNAEYQVSRAKCRLENAIKRLAAAEQIRLAWSTY